ncbi:hypothetical protein [Pontibacter russatus]|uniref:hypothetical protein n=1 Tax=Pontibacter russatus TaxID=2694929 RepID=UPI00137B595D|nr:hypothetical protein [Pontibacter russatus]
MGKRQKRINRKDIPQHIPELLQRRTVQVVLRTKVVLNGDILQLTADELQLQDHRFGKHILPIDQIEEIIYDMEAPY